MRFIDDSCFYVFVKFEIFNLFVFIFVMRMFLKYGKMFYDVFFKREFNIGEWLLNVF